MEEQAKITLSKSAIAQVKTLIAQEDSPENTMLRVVVLTGGCAGFQYDFNFDTTINEDDKTFTYEGATVVIDETSLELLKGSEVDYVEELIGSAFVIKNPNASSSCGCGSSFSI